MFDINEVIKAYEETKNDENVKHDTIIDHTRIEGLIYKEKRNMLDDMYEDADYTIGELQDKGKEKLQSFPHLAQDFFNMLYKINPSERESESLTDNALNFNSKIVDMVKNNPDYSALRLLTQGKDLESIEGAREFLKTIYEDIDNILEEMTGDLGVLNQIDKTNETLGKKIEEYITIKGMMDNAVQSDKSENELAPFKKKKEALTKQIEALSNKKDKYKELVDLQSFNNKDNIEKKIDKALQEALNKVNEISDTIDSFGTSDGRPNSFEGKTELIQKVNRNPKFREMARIIGKMRRLAKSQLNNSFTHGRGERVGIEFGDKLNKVLSSEYSYLATEETKAIFYKKYIEKKLKQFKEREVKHEGRGHVIYMVDESGSTRGGKEYWAKALGIALMDIAVKDHRNFAFIPFDTKVGNVHHVNFENYSEDIVLQIANTFLGGGTNFNEPLKLAMNLLNEDKYHNADMVFVSDGDATIDKELLEDFKKIKENKKVKCVGILLDKGGYGRVTDKTLKEFCDTIYKTSELSEDTIAENVMNGVI